MAAGRGPPPGIMGLLGPLLLGDGQVLVGACFVKDSAPGFHACPAWDPECMLRGGGG